MREKNATKPEKIVQLSRIGWTVRVGLFAAAFLVVSVILVLERAPVLSGYEFVVGEPSPRTFFSPFKITYVDEKSTELLRQEKRQTVPAVLRVNPVVEKEMTAKIDEFFRVLDDFHKKKEQDKSATPGKLPFEIPAVSFEYLTHEPVLEETRKNLEIMLGQMRQGVLDSAAKEEFLKTGTQFVSVILPDPSEKMVSLNNFPTLEESRAAAPRLLPESVHKNKSLKNAVLDIYSSLAVPNLVLDEEETERRRRKAAEEVDPLQDEIKKEELIVQRGMRITEEEKARLNQVQKKMAKGAAVSKFVAVGLLVFLTYLLFFVYLYCFERKTLLSLRMTLLIHSVLLVAVAICKWISIWPGSPYLMPSALASLLLILLARARLGIVSAAVMAVLVAPLAAFNADVILATLLSGAAGTFSALRVRKRLQFLKVGAAVGTTYFLVLFAFQIFRGYPITQESLKTCALGLANGFLVTTPLLFLLPTFFEWVFNLTTDVTLLELSDLNHPLLKRMVVEAPGTYHHSLVVSTLAEAACESIGANALLARVGCYFHDIGKIAKAEFFTENQANKYVSKHERMTPTMSCLVIMDHVRDGIELGKKYKLKESILRFIPEHQGTTVVYYFYKKALDNARPGEKVHSSDFRYPGPKPQSKETAVALLADSTEAASRSIHEPTPEKVRQLVRKIINDKFIDGQLDECDLTLRDLHKIQESFVHNLMAIFHTRVSYPATPESPDRPDLFKEDQFSKFRFDA